MTTNTIKETAELVKKLAIARSTRSPKLLKELSKEKNIFIIHNISSSIYTDEETLIKFISHKEKGIRFNLAQNEGASAKVLKMLIETETDKEVLEEIIYNKNCTKSLKTEAINKIAKGA